MSGREESRVLLADFMADLLDWLERDDAVPAFILDGHTALVDDFLSLHADERDRVARLVAAGRLRVGPWYILADEFLPSGEAHLRNLSLGIETATALGGVFRAGWLPDQFGHIAQMPQILAGHGIDTAVIYRGFGGEPGQESSEYVWSAPNGSSVLMLHLHADGYSFGYFSDDDDATMRARFARLRALTDARARTPHRLILNGGDRHWPDRILPAAVEMFQREEDVDVRISRFEDVVEAIRAHAGEASLPRWEGESRAGWRHAFAVVGGTASSRAWVKRENAACQLVLERVAEPLDVLVTALGAASCAAHLRHAWRLVIENQDHDVLCGTCVDRTYHAVAQRFRDAQDVAARVIAMSADDLLPADPHAHGDDVELHFFQSLLRARRAVVPCTVDFHIRDVRIGINPDYVAAPDTPPVRAFALLDAARRPVRFQVVGREEAWGVTLTRHAYPHQTRVDRFHLLVEVDLVACGITTLTVERREAFPDMTAGVRVEGGDAQGVTGDALATQGTVVAGAMLLANDLVQVEVGSDGRCAVRDLRRGFGFQDLNILEDGGDAGDAYSYSPPALDAIVRSVDAGAEVRVVEEGPLRAMVEVRQVMQVPAACEGQERRSDVLVEMPVVTRYAVTAGSPLVEVTVDVDNRARDHRLRAVFETGMETRRSIAGAQFAVVEREHVARDGAGYVIEKPANLEVLQGFVTVAGGGSRVDEDVHRPVGALTVHARGMHEYELATDGSGRLALTLLRAVGELSKSDLATRPGGDAAWKHDTPDAQCIGMQRCEYALQVHMPSETYAVQTRAAEDWQTPVHVFARRHASEPLPFSSLVSVDSDHAAFSALKTADDGNGFILRLYNPSAVPDVAHIRCALTLREVWVSELDEYPRDQRSMLDESIAVELDPYEIVTVRMVPA